MRFCHFPLAKRFSYTSRVRNTAVRNDAAIPIIRVMANPLMAPAPKMARMTPVMIVVRLESKIAEKAFLYPSSSALRKVLPAASSSLIRSLMSTFASTAMASERIIPAIPGRVSTAWNAARAPRVKKKFRSNAALITMPGVKPYNMQVKTKSTTKAMMNEIRPSWIASCPREGPTTSSCTIRTPACILPDLSTFSRSCASCGVKLPVMEERPPSMRPFTVGAEYT